MTDGHGSIAQWPEAERPRERLLGRGAGALADAELLAVLLRSGSRGETAVDLGRRVLALAGPWGVAGLGRVAVEDLSGLPGLGPAKAAAVLAALEIGRRVAAARGVSLRRLGDPQEAAQALVPEMAPLDREQFRVVLLDAKHGWLGTETVAVGGLCHVPADPREVFKPAVRRSAAAVILAHNHPSGDPTPSQQDIALTERLVAAGQLLGITVLDHLVIALRGYVSLAAQGLVGFDSGGGMPGRSTERQARRGGGTALEG